MLKALLKKQLLEIFSFVFFDKKKGRSRGKGGIIGVILLYILLLFIVGSNLYFIASLLVEPLVEAGLSWLYFALMSLMAVSIGVFGSTFSTYSALYAAKDNEMLFAMPVKPSRVLFVRLAGTYIMGLLSELVVMIPTMIAYFVYAKPDTLSIVFSLLAPFVLSVLVLALCCILGWLVALIAPKVRNKSLVTVLMSLVFLGGYYYLYFSVQRSISGIIAHADRLSSSIKVWAYPFYRLGLGASGDPVSMLIFIGIVAALFAAVYAVLSRGFIRLALSGSSSTAARSKARFSASALNVGSASGALVKKEFKRFLSSPNYILNCGFGTFFMLAGAVALFLKGGSAVGMLRGLGLSDGLIMLIACAAMCMITMNDITAPSISLEGKHIWLAQSMPVLPSAVLAAKLKLHLYVTLPPLFLLIAAAEFTLKPDILSGVFLAALPTASALFFAALGLAVNLKMPNLRWTTENIPIKQSMPVTICVLGVFILPSALAAIYYALRGVISPTAYLALVTAALLAASLLLLRWIFTSGARLFAQLD